MLRLLLVGGACVALVLAWQIPQQLEEATETVAAWTVTQVLACACILLIGTVVFLFRRNQKLVETLLENEQLRSDYALLIQKATTKMSSGFAVLSASLAAKMEAVEKVVAGRSSDGRISGS